MATTAEKRAAFRALHAAGLFRAAKSRGTSAAPGCSNIWVSKRWRRPAAASPGRKGTPITASPATDALAHLAALADAVSLPLNADFESGFAEDPEGVAESVASRDRGGRRGAFDRGSQPRGRRRALRPSAGAGAAARRARRDRGVGADVDPGRPHRTAARRPRAGFRRDRQARRLRRRRRRLPLCAGRAESPRTSARWRGRSRRNRSTCWRSIPR